MLYTILIILIWVGIGLFIWVVGAWIHKMITDKDFREANFESAREAERKRKEGKLQGEIWSGKGLAIITALVIDDTYTMTISMVSILVFLQ